VKSMCTIAKGIHYEPCKTECLKNGMDLIVPTPNTIQSIKDMADKEFPERNGKYLLWINGRKHKDGKWYSEAKRRDVLADSIISTISEGYDCLGFGRSESDVEFILPSKPCTTTAWCYCEFDHVSKC
jgi:hypothetical protein